MHALITVLRGTKSQYNFKISYVKKENGDISLIIKLIKYEFIKKKEKNE